MENATKALLIAAAVLIAIVLVAIGVKLLNSAGDTSGEAANVSGALQNSISNSSGSTVNFIEGLNSAW